ncbi:MAG TPA: DnaJ C-terminal domain-containing protein [Burkholderiales bacterium]|nr:DnaJ C-terminal domain-containing protein [Burkholderiales bacterium]
MQYHDYYKILGVSRTATDEEIRKAYKRLARKYHPDVSKELNAEEKFKEVGEAYDVLKDPEKRTAYDSLGSHRAGQEFSPPPGWHFDFGTSDSSFNGQSGAGFSDFFSTLFGQDIGGRHAGMREGERGRDFEVSITISLEEAANGVEREISFPVRSRQGTQNYSSLVRIPKGVTEGQRLRVPGRGGRGMHGGGSGDLYIVVHIAQHHLFHLEGHDLFLELPITPSESVLGAKIEVPTLTGRVNLRIREHATSGQKMRLPGKGMPKPGSGYGDLYVVLKIVTPTTLTEAERKLYQELAKISGYNPRANL